MKMTSAVQTEPITQAQAQQLAQEFHDIASAIGNYRIQKSAVLTDQQQFQLQSAQSQCLQASNHFITLSLFAQMDDLDATLKTIADGTAKAKDAIGKIKVVDKVLQIATAAAVLGASISSLNPSAVATGATQTSRKSSVQASISSLAGPKSATGALNNLANTSNDTELNGSGTTSRNTTLSTTLSARVTHVLPNGYLVLEGTKDVQVNSEHQFVKVRGIVRPVDLTPGNVVMSTQIAQLEINIDGKGVVNDAIHRPMFLYRLLLGLLPF